MTFTPNYEHGEYRLKAERYIGHAALNRFLDEHELDLLDSENEVVAYIAHSGIPASRTALSLGWVGVDADNDLWLFNSQEELLEQWHPIAETETEDEGDAAEDQGPEESDGEESDGETELEVETLLDSTQETRIEALGEARELLAGQVALFGTPTTPAVGDLIVLADYILRGTEDERMDRERVHNTITLFGPSVRITPLDEAGNPKEES